MKLLITGGCGFLGSNLAAFALQNGFEVSILDNFSRTNSFKNYEWLKTLGDFDFYHGDIRNKNDVERLIKKNFDAVFHLAGQVAMTTSIEDPYKDFEVNTLGTLNVLDSIHKYSKDTAVFYSSSNKVYGNLEQYSYEEKETRYICSEYPEGFDENIGLDFHSPYGCSKGAADQYMLDFNRIFGVKTVVFRHSSMYGGRQFSTIDQGWIGWFCRKALEQKQEKEQKTFTISGNGKQVRDILHSEDMVNLYFTCLEKIDVVSGNVFNIGGGMANSLSILELFSLLENMLHVDLTYERIPVRKSDQKVFVADIKKIQSVSGWTPQVNASEGILKMLNWLQEVEI